MKVEIQHHYGWTSHNIPDAETLAEAAYAAVLETHHFLTEGNHTYDAGEQEIKWGGGAHTFCSVRVYRGEGAPEFTGPEWARTDYWFAVQYRNAA